MKPFNITILEGFIIHNATIAADAFIIQDIDPTTCLLYWRICSLGNLIYFCLFSRPRVASLLVSIIIKYMDFNITPQQIFHVMVGFVIYCGFFIVSTSYLSFWAQSKQNYNPYISIWESFPHSQLIYSNNVTIVVAGGWISIMYSIACCSDPLLPKYSWILKSLYPHFDSAIRKSNIYLNLCPPSDLELSKKKKESKAGGIKM